MVTGAVQFTHLYQSHTQEPLQSVALDASSILCLHADLCNRPIMETSPVRCQFSEPVSATSAVVKGHSRMKQITVYSVTFLQMPKTYYR